MDFSRNPMSHNAIQLWTYWRQMAWECAVRSRLTENKDMWAHIPVWVSVGFYFSLSRCYQASTPTCRDEMLQSRRCASQSQRSRKSLGGSLALWFAWRTDRKRKRDTVRSLALEKISILSLGEVLPVVIKPIKCLTNISQWSACLNNN